MKWHNKLLGFMSAIKAEGIEPLSYSEKNGVGTLIMYGAIDEYWGVSADAVVRTLTGKSPDLLQVRLNSPGGSVFEGFAIYSFLKSLPYPVEILIDGYAASIASVIMMAGRKITASKVGMVMVHDAWTFAYGNASELRETADLLEKISAQMRDVYVAKTGKSVEEIQDLMSKDSWFTAAEAVEAGLIDEVISDENDESAQKAQALHGKIQALFAKDTPKQEPESWNQSQARLQLSIRAMMAETL